MVNVLKRESTSTGINFQAIRSSQALFIIAAVMVALILRLIVAAPTWFHTDEGYYLNISQNFIDHGGLTPYMWRLDNSTNIIAGSGTGYGIYVLAIWMKLVGVTLVNGRLLMITASFLNAGVMYFVARKWWGSDAAGLAGLVFGLAATSPFYSMVIRMDAFGMLAYSIVLLLHIYAVRDQKRWLHFAAGVVSVVAAEFHVLAILYIIALTTWYLITYVREIIQKRRLVLDTGTVYFALGGLVAGIIYIAIHILPNPSAYFSIPSDFRAAFSPITEFVRYTRFMLLRPVEFLLIFFSIMTALYRRQSEDWHFVTLLVMWLILPFVIGFPYLTNYTSHIWPLVAIGTAGFISRGIQPHGILQPWRVRFGLTLALLALSFNVGTHLLKFHPFEVSEEFIEPPAAAYVRENVPTDTVIMTEAWDAYYYHQFPNFLSYGDINDLGAVQGGLTPLEFWRRELPKVIIVNYGGEYPVVGQYGEDPELGQYMDEMNFVEVYPEVWVEDSLREQLALEILES